MEQLTPGARVLCRDAEWLVTRKEPVSADNSLFAIHCLGGDDLVRGHEAIFLTDLDELQPIDPRDTDRVPAMSGGKLSKLFLEAHSCAWRPFWTPSLIWRAWACPINSRPARKLSCRCGFVCCWLTPSDLGKLSMLA